MELASKDRKPRRMDTTSRDARRAVATTLARFNNWRTDLATFDARIERRLTDAERARILVRCSAIDEEVLQARTDLIFGLSDAPQRVAGHSRVVDAEKALDSVQASIEQIRQRLHPS